MILERGEPYPLPFREPGSVVAFLSRATFV
jgi:hypothetical protein